MRKLPLRQLMIVIAAGMSIFYLGYRLALTLNFATPYATFASLFLIAGEFFGIISVMLFFLQVWDTYEPPQQPVLEGRTVDIFVPTYNEDPQLLRGTLQACNRITYPHKTYLLDDGKRPEVAELAKELGVNYMTRPDNKHAKAGNLNHAMSKTDGEFVIIFDADHVPEPHFITRLVGYFANEKLAFVQTPHAFYNFDSFQARLNHKKKQYWDEGDLFYAVIQPGRNRWGCPIFAGSAAMFRRKALESVGYIATQTITEDMHTGLRMNAEGWVSMGVSERMVAGQAAPDVTTFHTQRLRWGEGNLSIMAYNNPFTTRGLTWAQAFCHFGSMLHWASGLFKLAIYLTPILMLFTGIPPVARFSWTLAAITAFYMLTSIVGTYAASNGHFSFWNSELFCMMNFWTSIRGLMRALFWRKFQKFIVTSKRGRQSKSIWPYIWPQAAIILVSVVALIWAWGRLAFKLSDDYYRPLLATGWVLFHMLLAWTVIHRALWPEDRRFSARHGGHLPVSYEFLGIQTESQVHRTISDVALDALTGMGVTLDINEYGLSFVGYKPLPVNASLKLTIRACDEIVECVGRVVYAKDLAPAPRAGVTGMRGIRYGVQIIDPTPAQIDALTHICMSYVVPLLYHEYGEGNLLPFWKRISEAIASHLPRRRLEKRYPFRFPVVINVPGSSDPAIHAVTMDFSANAMSALVERPLPLDTEVDFFLATSLGEITGKAKVLRSQPITLAAKVYERCVIHFQHIDGEGRDTIYELVTNPVPARFDTVLNPQRELIHVPVGKPALIGLAALLPLVLFEAGAFRFINRDDFFLREIAYSEGTPTTEEVARLKEIFNETLNDSRYPSTDRLVLLMKALTKSRDVFEINQVAMLLAPRDRSNLGLQIAQLYGFDQMKDYSGAEAEFRHLQAEEKAGRLTSPSLINNMLLAGARAAANSGDYALSAERFEKLLIRNPDSFPYRNEFAGVLISADKLKEAADLYKGIKPDLNAMLNLATIRLLQSDFDEAEKIAQQILKEYPKEWKAQKLLADVLSYRKDGVVQAKAILAQLPAEYAGDPSVRLRLAYIALSSKKFDEALKIFQSFIDEGNTKPEIIRGFVDSASSAEHLNASQKKIALEIAGMDFTNTADASYLARLGWVLQRFNELDKSAALLDRAARLDPNDPAIRKQLVGVLVTQGKLQDAVNALHGMENDVEVLYLRISINLKNKDYDAAEKICDQLLREHPDDAQGKRLLAEAYVGKKQFPEALALMEELSKANPKDTELRIRTAEVLLASGEYKEALKRFENMLITDFDHPALWRRYIDAEATHATLLTPEQIELTVRIYDRVVANARPDLSDVVEDPEKEAAFLSRLAWILFNTKNKEKANLTLDRAMALSPADPPVRKELAGVMAAAKRYKDALKLYEGVPLDTTDHYNLALIYAAVKDFKNAIVQCRAYLNEKPGDTTGMILLANLMSWKEDPDYKISLALFKQLIEKDPKNVELKIREAEVTMWDQRFADALKLFEAILESDFNVKKVWPLYVDAAAPIASQLTPAQFAWAGRIYEKAVAEALPDADVLPAPKPVESNAPLSEEEQELLAERSRKAAFYTRLGWIMLQGSKDNKDYRDKAAIALERARALQPKDVAVRKQLAGLLASVGRFQEAIDLFSGMKMTDEDRLMLAELFIGANDFTKAQAQCKALLIAQPNDRKALLLLANICIWNKQEPDYAQALAILDQLLAATPNDPELLLKQADVTFWSGAWLKAVALYERILKTNFDQKLVWQSYINAASAVAPDLSPAEGALAVRIYDAINNAKTRGANLEALGTIDDQALFLIHLSWVLYQMPPQQEKAMTALDQALAMKPREPKVRKELGSVLAATCTYRKDFKSVLAVLEGIRADNPGDTDIQLLLAEVIMASGDTTTGMARFEALLQDNFQPSIWRRFIDAASPHAKELTPGQIDWVVKIYEKAVVGARGQVPTEPDKEAAFLSRLGWILYTAKKLSMANRTLEAALALNPQVPAIRKELAGVLAASGKYTAALRLYDGLQLDIDDHYKLTEIYSAAKEFAKAEQQCQLYLKARPGEFKGKLLYANLLSWKIPPDYAQSLGIFGQLIATNPKDENLRIRQAEVTLWSGAYAEALKLFDVLLTAHFDLKDLWPAYIDAASIEVNKLTKEQVALVVKIFERTLKDPWQPPPPSTEPLTEAEQAALDAELNKECAFLSRLGWVLFKGANASEQAAQALELARELKPKDPPVRRELANLLALVGKYAEAQELFTGFPLTVEDRLSLARIQDSAKEYAKAEEQCETVLKIKPGDPAARRVLADILSWKTPNPDYARSLELFDLLVQQSPNDLDLLKRQAEVTLWSRAYPKALERFERLLKLDFRQSPEVWRSYIDAASSAVVETTLTQAQAELVVRIFDATVVAPDGEKAKVVLDREKEATYLTRLGWVLHRIKQNQKATIALDRALALQPQEVPLRKELVGILAAAGMNKAAIQLMQKLPPDAQDPMLLVNLYAGDRDFAKAEAECRALLKDKPNDKQLLTLLASVLSWKKDYPGSIRMLEELIAKYPQDRELQELLAKVTLWSGDHKSALVRFQALYAGREPTAADRLNLANLFLAAKDYDHAAEQCELILKAQPGNLEAMRLLADVLSWRPTNPDYPKAIQLLEQVVQKEPENSDALLRLGEVTLWNKNFEGAIRLFEKLLQMDVELTPSLCQSYIDAASPIAGKLSASQALWALKIYDITMAPSATPPDAAVKPDPAAVDKEAGYLMRLGWVMHQLGQPDKASVALDRALALQPKGEDVRKELANILAAVGKNKQALELFATLKLNTKDRINLVNLYSAEKLFDKAEAECRIIVQEEPTDANRLLLANVLSWKKAYPESLAILERLTNAEPKDRDLAKRLAEVTLWSGDFGLALTRFQAMLQADFNQPDIWHDYMSAAAAVVKPGVELNPEQIRLVRAIAARAVVKTAQDARFWSLLMRGLVAIEKPRAWNAEIDREAAFLSRLAWVLSQSKDTGVALVALDQAVELQPKGPDVRRELAGVLGALNRYHAAIAMYQGVPLEYKDRLQLIIDYSAIRDFANAELQTRAILQELPDDKQALRHLADVLSWSTQFTDSIVIFRQLVAKYPDELELWIRLAEVTLWSGDFARALNLYQYVLEKDFDRRDQWSGFVDAAASVERKFAAYRMLSGVMAMGPQGPLHVLPFLTQQADTSGEINDAQGRLALRIYDQLKATPTLLADILATPENPKSEDTSRMASFLSRLSWVMLQIDHKDKSNELLNQAIALDPPAPEVRVELAGVLGAARRFKEALQMYEGIPLGIQDLYKLAELHAALDQFDLAERDIRTILNSQPGDRTAMLTLANILSWKKDYTGSLKLFEELIAEYPKDLDLQIRRAEVTLWSNNPSQATELLAALLEKDFNQPKLWWSYLDAAAGTPSLSAAQRQLALKIANQKRIIPTGADADQEAASLSRVAWVLIRSDENEASLRQAKTLLDRAIALKPKSPKVRKELAGVLAAAHQGKLALKMYEGLTITDNSDRLSYAGILAANNNFAEAEKLCREVLLSNPDDPSYAEAQRLLPDLLMGKHEYKEAAKLYHQWIKDHPIDQLIRIRLAQVSLGLKDYPTAVAQFQGLVDEGSRAPDVLTGYIDAAASIKNPSAKIRKTVIAIQDQVANLPLNANNAVFQSRLGWVLYSVKDFKASIRFYRKAVTMDPENLEIRLQYAQALDADGQSNAAAQQYDILLRRRSVRPAMNGRP